MCLHTNVHIYMINQSTDLINTLQYKIAGLCYLKSFNPRHLLCCYNKISIMSAYCRVCFTIKAEKTFPGLLLKTKYSNNTPSEQ
jgi:hypothetical protein